MSENSSYQQALDYLYSFIDYSMQRNLRVSPERFDLGRVRDLMACLGNPHQTYPLIHVAGTKGKGSVSVLCASALQVSGYRVGLYTQPHLQEYTERIQVNRHPIPQDDLVILVEELKPYVAAVPNLTTFEIGTALAFWYFARQKVDVAVIEVGLGGRLDATNVVTPNVAVITSLSYDHAEILGDTLEKIATEKAGIIKPGIPVILAPQREEARRTVLQIAHQHEAPVIEVGRDLLYAPVSHSLKGQSFLLWPASEQEMVDAYIESGGVQEWEPTRLSIPLLGYHQVENAATAYAALQALRASGVAVSEDAIRDGFEQAFWPGRFEVLQHPQDGQILVLDSAHNRYSALRLRLALGDYFPGQPVVLVFGVSQDKEIEGIFAELLPGVRHVIATKSAHPRAAEPEFLVTLAHHFGRPAKAILPLEAALAEACRIAGGEAIVLAAGSIFLAGGIRQAWLNGKLN
jgi:dihydrofolate synthase/folylpolyglutamate synthase